MLMKIFCLLLIINTYVNNTFSMQISEFNETKALITCNSQLTELRAELARQGKLSYDVINRTEHNLLKSYGRNCAEATTDSKPSGIYEILIPSYSNLPFKVTCDSNSHGDGWTVILKRMDGSVDFYRNWDTYKKGFGDLDGEFFLGLDKIHALTAEFSQELLVVLEDIDGNEKYEIYEKFAIGDEDELYALHTLGKAYGTAGDSLKKQHTMKFSTYNRDNDRSPKNCAVDHTGAWWYNNCHESNLAGKYKDFSYGKGINWYTFRDHTNSHKIAVMMLRPRK